MKKIKILHLTTDSKIGGTEKMLITLAENYDRNKFEMIFVTLIGDGELLNELIMRGCKAYSINMRSKLEIYKILRLYKILKNEKPDILNTYLFHADQLGRILGKIAGIKIIVSSFRSPDYWKKKIHILIEKFTALFADCFTANSELAKNIVVDREKISASKIYVIKNGIKIEDNKFNGEISELKLKNNVPSDKIVIGIVAN
ncbi:MAG TPA: glycosyltransferase, partial [bacterium]|nr:glycosyltransferase [bacterium]